MPTVDGSRSLLSAGVDYKAGDWASVGAEASLDLLAAANLNRGVDIGLGVEALARLDGSIRQFLAADVNGQAHAAARVRAQVQMPLDLFDEAGIAVRLQAVAEAAAGVQLSIGLRIGDFLKLAGEDPRLRGVPIELLKIFLDEFTIQGGVMAKAAAAAMAYANIVATGSFIKRGTRLPGFTIAAEAGVGLKVGAGFRVFARFGVDDPRRLIRRTIDVAVDETLTAIASGLPAEARPIVAGATVPLKIALRSTFELGAALAENDGAFASGDGEKLALRLAQVGLEEMQRFALERIVEFASSQLRMALRDLGFNNAAWSAARPQRVALRDRLNALPEEPFEATDANRAYWRDVVADAVSLAAALGGNATIPPFVAEPLAIVWCGAQLLMKSVERISVAQARASVIGASPVTATEAFEGTLPAAPAAVQSCVNATLGRAAGARIQQADAVNYLLRVTAYRIDQISPAAASVLTLLTGKGGAPAEALTLVFSNLGAFVPGNDGRVNAEASLAVLRNGLRAYLKTRLDAELLPLIVSATADAPEVRMYLDEVLLSTLRTVVDVVFDAVLTWRSSNGDTQRALRELCSSLLMRLFGRSLVVTGDVLLAHALGLIQSELRQLAASVNKPGGIAPTLARVTQLDRRLVADLVTETLEVCAETFRPMSAERRARMRDLMYHMIDTTPPDAGATALESLKSAGMVGNAEAALALAQLLGEEIAGNLIRFIEGLLTHVAVAALALLVDVIKDVQRAIEVWQRQVEALARRLVSRLAEFGRQIAALRDRLVKAVDQLLDDASAMLGGFALHASSRAAVRQAIQGLVTVRALGALAAFQPYAVLLSGLRAEIAETASNVVNSLLDTKIFDQVVTALLAASAQTAALVDDLREIQPGDDLAAAIADKTLDRIEVALRQAFHGDPTFSLGFNAGILGNINLPVRIPIGTFVSVARNAIRSLERFNKGLAGAVGTLTSLLSIEAALEKAENDQRTASADKREADQLVIEIRDPSLDILISQPQPGMVIKGQVKVKLRIPGGSAALLSSSGLSHRRLFVWVNEQELPLAAARVTSEATTKGTISMQALPMAPRPNDQSQAGKTGVAGLQLVQTLALPLQPSNQAETGKGRPGHPLTRARAMRYDAERQAGLNSDLLAAAGAQGPSRRATAAGLANRVAGVALAAPLTMGGFLSPIVGPGLNLGISDGGPVMVVEIDVPASLLHEGVNTVACALVPGSVQRRVERAVSFLHVPAAPAAPGRPTMGTILLQIQTSGALIGTVQPQDVSSRRSVPTREAPRGVRGDTWVAPLSERKKALASSRKNLKRELAAIAKQHEEIRTANAKQTRRPRKATPTVKAKKGKKQ